jgi:hypothetical protein
MNKGAKGTGRASSKPVRVEAVQGETEAATMARVMVTPYLRHGIVGSSLAEKMVGKLPGEPRFDDYSVTIKATAQAAQKGELTMVSEYLTAQALSLDAMFTELTRRMTMNLGEYPQTAERYGRLALKAQSNCRATLEALVQLHRPREQTVRHVHVNEGGQAVIADQVHHHAGGARNANSDEQPHATEAAGASAALPSPNPLGNGLPISGCERAEAVPNARGKRQRSA